MDPNPRCQVRVLIDLLPLQQLALFVGIFFLGGGVEGMGNLICPTSNKRYLPTYLPSWIMR